jgi:hypothetical protein
MDFRLSPLFLIDIKFAHNGLRVGDVAMCCACGKGNIAYALL